MQEELTLTGVTRTFDGRCVLDDVSFTARSGRTTGLVGAAGAGRTTALRIVMGVLAPESGTVALGGRPLGPGDRRRFGYLPAERGLYPRMSVLDQLVFLARVHGVRPGPARRRADALLDRLGLGDRAGDRLQELRLGDQQRVQIAAALVHEPTVLVLDEPFAGLDRLAAGAVTELLREQADAGVPVLLSLHRLDPVERWCDDVVVLERGRVVAAGDVEGVRLARTPRRLVLTVEPAASSGAGPGDASDEVPEALLTDVLGVPGVGLHGREGRRLVLDLADDADDQAVLAAALRHGRVRELAPVRPTFAEVFPEAAR